MKKSLVIKMLSICLFATTSSGANGVQNFGDEVVECLAAYKATPESAMFDVFQKLCEQTVENKFEITKQTDMTLMAPSLNASICVIKRVSNLISTLNIAVMSDCNQAEEVVWRQVIEECYPYFQEPAHESIANKFQHKNEVDAFLQGLYWGNRAISASIVYKSCNKTYLK